MPKENLTDRRLKSLKPAEEGKRYEISDGIVPGLLVRVTDKGTKTFCLLARYPGKGNPARREIGKYGAITLDDARQTARQWHELIQRGIDPQIHIIEAKAKEQVRQENTVGAVFEDYVKRALYEKDGKTAKLRNAANMERGLRSEFIDDKVVHGKKRAGLKNRPITGVTKTDIVRVILDKIDEGYETMAFQLFAWVRGFFNWAIDRGTYGIEVSPCDRLKPKSLVGERASRDRVLTDDEIRALWIATGKIPYPYGPLYRVLLLTGLRRREASNAVRDELIMKEALWTIPKERMKGKIVHHVPLADLVAGVIDALPIQNAGNFLFSTTAGEKAVNGFSKAKAILDREMLAALKGIAEERGDDPSTVSLKPFVIHDLRRTARTRMAKLGVPEHVAEAVIAHKKSGVNAIYNQWEYLDEKRDALARWATAVRALVEPQPDNVISLTGRSGA